MELTDPSTVVAVDPGGVTGVAFRDKRGIIRSWEVPDGFAGMGKFWSWFAYHAPDYVVVENFIVNPGTHKKDPRAFRDTNDIIGALRFLTSEAGATYVLQTPAHKRSVSDAMLRSLDLYDPSPGGHANDALRHLIRYLISVRDSRTLEVLSRD